MPAPTYFAPTSDPDAPVFATYADDRERYLVALVVSYDARDASSPEHAIELAVDLITGAGSGDTLWSVHDRQTGVRHVIEQGDALTAWPSGDVVRRRDTD